MRHACRRHAHGPRDGAPVGRIDLFTRASAAQTRDERPAVRTLGRQWPLAVRGGAISRRHSGRSGGPDAGVTAPWDFLDFPAKTSSEGKFETVHPPPSALINATAAAMRLCRIETAFC